MNGKYRKQAWLCFLFDQRRNFYFLVGEAAIFPHLVYNAINLIWKIPMPNDFKHNNFNLSLYFVLGFNFEIHKLLKALSK